MKKTKVYITQYALTKGIIEAEVEESNIKNDYIFVKNNQIFLGKSFKLNHDIFLDKKLAIENAYHKRDNEIKKLYKNIELLKDKNFS